MSSFITAPPQDLNANQSLLILWTAGSAITVAVLSVFLRFVSRLATKIPLLLDDWLILATLPISVAMSSISIWGCIYHHFGTHVLATATLDSLHNFLRGLYVFEITYAFSIAGAKFSMMAIYWRIFPHPKMRWPLRITASFTGAWLIATTLVPIFSCNPVQGFWEFEIPKTCIDSLAFFIGSAATNISIDVAMLLIPVSMVVGLRISFSQKIAVCAIFGLGIFVTACSCLRLNQLIIASSNGLYTDPTWDLVGSALWSDIETSASIVCACLPTMRPLLRLVLHGSLKDSSHHSRRSKRFSGDAGSTLIGSPRKGRYHRFSDDRPLSGVQGDGEWLGKGVGAPGYYYGNTTVVTAEIELRESPPVSPVRSPLPVYSPASNGRVSVMSDRPLVPARSPLRWTKTETEVPSHYSSIIETYSRDTISNSHSTHYQHTTSAPPVPAIPTGYEETPIWGRSRRASHEIDVEASSVYNSNAEEDEEEEEPQASRTRTLIRDPDTNKYVLAPKAGNTDERSTSPDWEAGWENELDRSIERMWGPSRKASVGASETASAYEWGEPALASAIAVPLPPMNSRPEWERVRDTDGKARWQAKSIRGKADVVNLDAKGRGGWF